MNTDFTLQTFQDYFRKHTSLTVPPKQKLWIRDIRILGYDPLRCPDWPDPLLDKADQIFRYVMVMNKILTPIGVFITFKGTVKKFWYKISPDLLFFSDFEATYYRLSGDPVARLSDLFNVMLKTEITFLQLRSGQKLALYGFTDEEDKLLRELDGKTIGNIFNKRGSGIKGISFFGNFTSVDGYRLEEPYVAAYDHLALLHGEVYTHICAFLGVFSRDAFCKRFLSQGLVKLNYAETLKVEPVFTELEKKITNGWEGEEWVSQLFAPFNKKIQGLGSKLSTEEENGVVTINGHLAPYLQLLDRTYADSLHFSIEALGRDLIEHKRKELCILPDQKVYFYELEGGGAHA